MDSFYGLNNTAIIPKVKTVRIANKGVIKKADIKFRDGLNVIIGKNATGKTTVINALKEKYAGKELTDFSSWEKEMLLLSGLQNTVQNKCILVDGLFSQLETEQINKIAKELEKSGNQMIATFSDVPGIRRIKANFIDTGSFELNTGG